MIEIVPNWHPIWVHFAIRSLRRQKAQTGTKAMTRRTWRSAIDVMTVENLVLQEINGERKIVHIHWSSG